MHPVRTDVATRHPFLYEALETAADDAGAAAFAAGFSPRLIELLRIRVSQLNGCAFSLRLHTGEALKKGESVERIAVLPAWRETFYFDDAEREALAVVESVTEISSPERHVPGPPTASVLTEDQVSAVTWVAIAAGALNRVAVMSGSTFAATRWRARARGARSQ